MKKDEIKESEHLVSIEQLAKIWGVSRVQIHRYISEGRIVEGVERVGNRLVFDLRVVKYPESKVHDRSAERDERARKAVQ